MRLERTLPSACWRETTEAFGTRLRACCADVNASLGVEALCRDFPKRVQLLLDQGGGRLHECRARLCVPTGQQNVYLILPGKKGPRQIVPIIGNCL